MSIELRMASDPSFNEIREYKSLDECIGGLIKEHGYDLIVGAPMYSGCEYTITIYDDYVE